MTDLFDLNYQSEKHCESIIQRIRKVGSSSSFINGSAVDEFEELSARHLGFSYCCGVSSGTDALLVSLMALRDMDMKNTPKCFLPSFTYTATAEAVLVAGFDPIYVDVDARTALLDLNHLEQLLDEYACEGDVIMPVELYGNVPDYSRIDRIAQNRFKVLIDGAQSFGSFSDVRRGENLYCTSFFPTKALGCWGDGGAIYTDDHDTWKLLKSIANHGKGSHKYDVARLGLNARLDTIQAAVLLDKLLSFDALTAKRRNNALKISGAIANSSEIFVVTQSVEDNNCALLTLAVEVDRDGLRDSFSKAGIPTNIYYPNLVSDQNPYKTKYQSADHFPGSEALVAKVLTIPCHAGLSASEIDQIISILSSH